MPRTARQYWAGLQGRTALNFNWGIIDHDSTVIVTVSEYSVDPNDLKHSPRFVGAAPVRVSNISPHSPPYDPNHGVGFVVTVDWGSPLHIVTDITVLDDKPVYRLWDGGRLAFVMQHQQQTNWCWAAVSTSISLFYNAGSTWTQCAVANQQTGQTDCCGAGAGGANCNSQQPLDNPLSIVGHLDHMVSNKVDFATVESEIKAGRPLCIRIGWSTGGGHFLTAMGVDAPFNSSDAIVAVDDPIYGRSDQVYNTLATNYQGSGTWTHSYYTRA
ncbi:MULTISPECIES: papain-like cysteine protease family protein [unclassified Streptomyces]|uniref:papain-like cysteine protease family protein n=1 Tax=unclassified Streptomyces TaxID=2593676 RepID=UPI0037F5A39D